MLGSPLVQTKSKMTKAERAMKEKEKKEKAKEFHANAEKKGFGCCWNQTQGLFSLFPLWPQRLVWFF